MFESYKTSIGIAAGVAGTLFIGYFIYKKKLRHSKTQNSIERNFFGKSDMPNLNDHEAIRRYFVQEIQLGESEIARGDFESGVEHLSNAIIVCGQPTLLLQVLETSLTGRVFGMLLMKLQEFRNRFQQGEVDKSVMVAPNGISEKFAAAAAVVSYSGGQTTAAALIDDIE